MSKTAVVTVTWQDQTFSVDTSIENLTEFDDFVTDLSQYVLDK